MKYYKSFIEDNNGYKTELNICEECYKSTPEDLRGEVEETKEEYCDLCK